MTESQAVKPKYITPTIFERVHKAVSTSLGIDSQFDNFELKEEVEFGANSGGGRVIRTSYEVFHAGSSKGTYACTVDLNQAEELARIQWPQRVKPKITA